MPAPAGSLRAVLMLLLIPAAVDAQEPDTVPVPVPSTIFVSEGEPPVTPARAFLTSLLVPGLAQTRLQRPSAAALFTAAEVLSVGMLSKSLYDFNIARKFEGDSLPLSYETDPETGEIVRDSETGDPVVTEWTPGRYTTELRRARRLHVEDWIAVLVLNHLVSAIDAYVAANLWDMPVDIAVRGSPPGVGRGTVLTASFRW